MQSSRRAVPAVLLALVFLPLQGCGAPAVERMALRVAGQDLSVEVARTAAARERGLMERRDLGPRDGMLFLFDRDQRLTFWMKNTPSALSIAYITADGRIVQIEDMEPLSEKIVPSRGFVRYALEMRKGAFEDLGIAEGDTIVFPPGFPGPGRVEP
jgi:uncharacterized protein